MTDGPLGKIYDLEEAAAYLRVSKQVIAKAARRHGIGAVFARDVRFHADDIRALWDAVRVRAGTTTLDKARSYALADDAYESMVQRATAKRTEAFLRRRNGRKT